jgi:hypothetical protein
MRTIQFTGREVAADGGPATGWVRVAALAEVPVPDADTVISIQDAERELVDGAWSMPLVIPTDAGSTVPVLLEVHILLTGTRPVSTIRNVQTSGDAIDYADAPEVILYPSDQGIPAVPWSAVGQPGGVAPLSGSGKVPPQFLPASGGGTGGLTHHHLQETAQAVWGPVEHLLGQRPSSVSCFSPDWATQYDEFTVHHLDENNLLIEGDVPVDGHALITI